MYAVVKIEFIRVFADNFIDVEFLLATRSVGSVKKYVVNAK